MSIYVYWNRVDLDCRKMFHFLSESDSDTIIPLIQKNEIDRVCTVVPHRETIETKLSQASTVIFCSHGDVDRILKYQMRDRQNDFDNYSLVDNTNAYILQEKIVIALCCYCAKGLGRISTSGTNSCKAFVGFEGPIVYGLEKNLARHAIYEAYKSAFKNALELAVSQKCTVKKFRDILYAYIQKEHVKYVFSSKNLDTVFATTMKGLVALGDVDALVF